MLLIKGIINFILSHAQDKKKKIVGPDHFLVDSNPREENYNCTFRCDYVKELKQHIRELLR